MSVLESAKVQELAKTVEESTRSTKEGVKYFIEPAPGTLSRAKNKRHHIIFGRRGSGKSSLLAKVSADLTVNRNPVAYVDLEEFKGHSYPDVLLSVLIKTLSEFKCWMDTAAINPANNKSFWKRLFGSTPRTKGFNRSEAKQISGELAAMVLELNHHLFSSDEAKIQSVTKHEEGNELRTALTAGARTPVVSATSAFSASQKGSDSQQTQAEYTSKKIEVLHRNIMRYKALFQKMTDLANGPAYLLLDDLYHIRLADQADVVDYFHRIAKGSKLWIKVGTIRHRSRWYMYGDPPRGMKLGDDAEEIDLDVTLEKYDLTKRFLLRILEQFARERGLKTDDFLTEGARDRLVLASGGVARDFLTIFRRALDVARERLAHRSNSRGDRIGAEDVNKAAGEYDKFKREDFSRDAGKDDQAKLLAAFAKLSDFCLSSAEANCFLVDKDYSSTDVETIAELVDLKFLHRVRSRVTVRERVNRVYDAYMLDLSQYTGERARRNFDIVEFWGSHGEDSLRKSRLIYSERPRSSK